MGKKKPALPGVFSALHDWLARKVSLPSPAEIERVIVDDEFGGFVGLEHRVPVHNASDLPPQNLQGSWEAVSEYLHEAMVVISNDIEPGWLDREEVEMVIEQLGNPPPMCLPLYFISVGSGAEERLVYVGKTSSNVARFDNGHAAFTKLHAPEYDGQAKHIYLASVVLLAQYGQLKDNSGHLPLEWIRPLSKATEILASVENALIYEFKPPLNENLKNAYRPKRELTWMIQNCLDEDFLQWTQVAPFPTTND